MIESGWGYDRPDPFTAQLARWDHAPCVAVLENGRVFHDALMRAFARLAAVSGPKTPRAAECPAEALVIVVSGDPAAFLAQLKARKELLLDRNDRFDTDAYEKMAASQAPVSVWRHAEARLAQPVMPTRARPMTYSVATRSFTFVWADRLGGYSLEAAALYAAFATLTLGVPERPSPQRSLLNLFSKPACAPSDGGLTAWDATLLNAIYESGAQAWLYGQLIDIDRRLPSGEPCPSEPG